MTAELSPETEKVDTAHIRFSRRCTFDRVLQYKDIFSIKSESIGTGSQVTITAVRRVWVALVVVVHGGTTRHIWKRKSTAKTTG